MSLAFSSNENDVLKRNVDLKSSASSPANSGNIEEAYEIRKCAEWIKTNGYSKVALQFPDSLLVESVEVALKLEEITQAEIFVLGDVTYGSCCVDFVSAEHAAADSLVHFGHSCLSPLPVDSIPVLFVFVRADLDCDAAISTIHTNQELLESSCLLLLYEVVYAQAARILGQKLQEFHENIVLSSLSVPGEKLTIAKDAIIMCNRVFTLPNDTSLSECSVLYIGHENLTQYNLIMSFNLCPFYTYNPSTRKLVKDSMDVNRMLRRRFYIVERLKDAQIIGILVGTLGVDKYLPVIDHLKELIKKRKKRSYVLAVGKPNVPKLANFPEMEAFVLVACAENSLLDSKEYLAPIATPFELELALNPSRNFQGGHYVMEYSSLLPDGANHVPLNIAQDDNDAGDVSLVTGKLRTFNVESLEDYQLTGGSSLVIRNGMALATLHARAGGEHLAQRSWRGLEQQLGVTPVATVKEGMSGIAAMYEGEG